MSFAVLSDKDVCETDNVKVLRMDDARGKQGCGKQDYC